MVVAVVSRLPQLTSPHLLLDGDEAILGLMAKHLAEGREVPLFFYGQTYGLAAIEAAGGALAFRVAGVGDVQLKLAMLAIWSSGVIGLFAAMARLLGVRRAFWVAMLFVLLPAWSVWSMKARGGYLTAFAATSWLWFVLLTIRDRPRTRSWSAAGALTALIFLAQRLWLPGVLPAVGWLLWRERRVGAGLAYMGGGAAVLAAVAAWSGLSVNQVIAGPRRTPAPISSPPEFLDRIYSNLTGSYYLGLPIDPGSMTVALTWTWSGLLGAMLVLQLYRLATGRFLAVSHVLCVSVLVTLAATWLLIDAPEPRFLLPLSGLLVPWVAVEAVDLSDRLRVPAWTRAATVAGLLAIGAVSLLESSDYAYLWDRPHDDIREKDRLSRTIDFLEAHGVRHVFATNGLLQWQLLFYSSEGLVARYMSDRDRYPPYVAEVDRALAAGEPVALVGYATPMRELVRSAPSDTAIAVDDRYFVSLGPDKDLLSGLGFRFFADRGR